MEKAQLSFIINENNHILMPNNEVSNKAQQEVFILFEKMQYDYIRSYNVLSENQKYQMSNKIGNFFVNFFLNKDGASFRMMMGFEHKGLMTQEELKNIIRDYEIAKQKKDNKYFKTFLLLDLLFLSNRRADAIIINNNYEIDLYDFSEGEIARKISNYTSIEHCANDKEVKQYLRKQTQSNRIMSYSGKMKIDDRDINHIIIDKEEVSVKFFNLRAKFYYFNYSYESYIYGNCEEMYIPNSLCFLMKKEDVSSVFFALPLKYNIDSPFFITEQRPEIKQEYIDHAYNNDTYIGVSLIYLTLFIESFTYFKIRYTKNAHNELAKNHFYVLKNAKKRYVYFEDTRTNKWVPLSYGFLEKHMFMNVDLETLVIYISSICNQEYSEDIIKSIIKYDDLNASGFDFFILKH